MDKNSVDYKAGFKAGVNKERYKNPTIDEDLIAEFTSSHTMQQEFLKEYEDSILETLVDDSNPSLAKFLEDRRQGRGQEALDRHTDDLINKARQGDS